MQFRDLKTQYNTLSEKIDNAIRDVLVSSNFISGKQVSEIEKELADYVGMKHCITCANGTDALQLALMAWNIGKGDAVFVPDFTFFSSGEVVSSVGATPVFIDVRRDTFNIDTNKLEDAIQSVLEEGKLKPKVIVAVDLFGQPADYNEIGIIADKYDLFILEDAAQGFGGSSNGKKACSFGDISTTSFFPAKPLGCYGDGGAIFTNHDDIAKLLRSYCVHGKGECKYDNVRVGMNSRLDTLQAAILKVKFDAFRDYELENVNKVANRYSTLLENLVEVPIVEKNNISSWAQYTIKLKNEEQRDSLQKYLRANEIPSMIYYPKPMHCQEAFHPYEQNDDLDVTYNLCKVVLSLPIHPYMTESEQDKVILAVKDYFI